MANGSWSGKIFVLFAIAAAVIILLFANQVLPGYFAKTPAPNTAEPSSPAAREDDFYIGNRSATPAQTIIEFGDFECPYCAAAGVQAQRLVARHPETKLVWKDCPLPNHPNSASAAAAARCAGAQGKFWQYHDLLFAAAGSIGPDFYLSAAAGLGLDAAAFASCLSSGETAARVRASLAECAAAEVTDLPWFFIGGKIFSGGNAVDSLTNSLETK
jgi:protein-disulfide isomerase